MLANLLATPADPQRLAEIASFNNFTDNWNGATGKPVHSCAEKPEYCPDQSTLTNMRTMSIWGEGVKGDVHLEVKSVAGYGCAAAALDSAA